MTSLDQKLNTSNKKTKIWTKMSGAGNSFWITHFLSADSKPPPDTHWPGFARKLCRQMTKPADGMAVLLPSKECDFKWLVYNADGSMAEMCGNLACCVIEYVFKKNLVPANKTSVTFETKAGKITGKMGPAPLLEQAKGPTESLSSPPARSQVFLPKSQTKTGPFTFLFQNQKITYMFINSGVPHAVIRLKGQMSEASPAHLSGKTKPKPDSHLLTWPSSQQEWADIKALAKALRKNTRHHKNGMNVSFYTQLSPKEPYVLFPKQRGFSEKQKSHTLTLPAISLLACSFERGVEDWTPACGTGALAVSSINKTDGNDPSGRFNPIFLVQMPGGVLQVKFHPNKTLSLISPVQWLEEKTF